MLNNQETKAPKPISLENLPRNRPYRKEYDEEGNVTNPIKGYYPSPFPNRKLRRSKISGKKVGGLVVTYLGNGKFVKYERYLQYIPKKIVYGDMDENFEFKIEKVIPARTVQHYREVKPNLK